MSHFLFFADLLKQKTAHVQACLGCQQAQTKCQVSGPGLSHRKRTREEEGPEEGPSKQAQGGWVWKPRDRVSEGGADLAHEADVVYPHCRGVGAEAPASGHGPHARPTILGWRGRTGA